MPRALGHGVRTEAGALVSPVWMVPKAGGQPTRTHRPFVVSTLCSGDDGKTWWLGQVLGSEAGVEGPNESVAAALPGGTST